MRAAGSRSPLPMSEITEAAEQVGTLPRLHAYVLAALLTVACLHECAYVILLWLHLCVRECFQATAACRQLDDDGSQALLADALGTRNPSVGQPAMVLPKQRQPAALLLQQDLQCPGLCNWTLATSFLQVLVPAGSAFADAASCHS